MAEYYGEVGVKCRYMHSEIETLERVKILRDLRKGEFDVLIGINLLREGPGFAGGFAGGDSRCGQRRLSAIERIADSDHWTLRPQSEWPRVLYADRMTDSMQKAIDETDRRRAIQEAYNVENGITPESIVRPLDMSLAGIIEADYADLTSAEADGMPDFKSQEELDAYIAKLEARCARPRSV